MKDKKGEFNMKKFLIGALVAISLCSGTASATVN